jgi:uncharacterized protein YbaA (DUF1428 family)
MAYVDGFVLPIPRKNLAAYRRMAQKAGRVWMEHGALDYWECVGDDLDVTMGRPFPRQLRLRPGETVVFSWIVYRSRAHRDGVNAKVMKDPRIANMSPRDMPFDAKRMCYGGFRSLVAVRAERATGPAARRPRGGRGARAPMAEPPQATMH